jgi:CMP-N-acetylneuraminic acid synthetase
LAKESFRELHNSARLAANDLRAVLHHLEGGKQLEFALAVAGAGGHFVIQAVHKFQFSAKVLKPFKKRLVYFSKQEDFPIYYQKNSALFVQGGQSVRQQREVFSSNS